MKDVPASVLAGIASVMLVVSFFFLCVFAFAFNTDFYMDEYSKLDTAEYVGVSEDELVSATDNLLSYLKGERETLYTELSDGSSFFNEKETLHMADVKNLCLSASAAAYVLLFAGAGLMAVIFALKKNRAFFPVINGFFCASTALLVFFAAIAVYVAMDFPTFWTNFHHVFFTNDLWLLDPATDRLIRMYETQFFFDMVLYILLLFLAVFIPLYAAAGIAVRRKKKRVR